MKANTNQKAQDQPQTKQVAIDADYTEVSATNETNNTEEVNTMNENTINTNEQFQAALAEAGVTKGEFIQAFADGIAAGTFTKDDLYEVTRRADYLIKADKKAKREMEKAEAKAKREAARAEKSGKSLTVGQKVWIGIGIAATVVVVGGIVWWIIQKKKNATTTCDIDNADYAGKLSARFDRLVTV